MAREIASVQPPRVNHGTQFVHVFVGAEKREFALHKNLICAASDFFQSAFNGAFSEATEQSLHLPEEDRALFKLFYDWLYSGRVASGLTPYIEKKEDERYMDEFWLEVYHAADRLLIEGLAELALETLKNLFSEADPFVPSKPFITELFDEDQLTDQLSDMKVYVVRHVAFWLESTADKGVWEELLEINEKFAVMLAKALVTQEKRAEGSAGKHPRKTYSRKEHKTSNGTRSRESHKFRAKQLTRAKLIAAPNPPTSTSAVSLFRQHDLDRAPYSRPWRTLAPVRQIEFRAPGF